MDDYTNNIHARIDNILADAYFGAGATPKKQASLASESMFDVSGLVWFILGVVVGVLICYGVWYNAQTKEEETKE
jgi:hypothetical protein